MPLNLRHASSSQTQMRNYDQTMQPINLGKHSKFSLVGGSNMTDAALRVAKDAIMNL